MYSQTASSEQQAGKRPRRLPTCNFSKQLANRRTVSFFSLSISILILGLAFFYLAYVLRRPITGLFPTRNTAAVGPCHEPTIRREWRTLSDDEKLEYISAAKCLTEIPSLIGLNGTAHDDFAFVHMAVGEHSKSAFSTIISYPISLK